MTQSATPQVFMLEAGSHWLCTCEKSKNSPYCDGSHQGTPFKPLSLELKTPKQVEISH